MWSRRNHFDLGIGDPKHASLTSAKLSAMTAIDLLWDDAAAARETDFVSAITEGPISHSSEVCCKKSGTH